MSNETKIPAVAYRLVRRALKEGVLVRPNNCQRCGAADTPCSDGRSRIQAHHSDYERPLDVEWICAKCHRKETPLPAVVGGVAIGEKNGQARLTVADVMLARRLRVDGLFYREIAARLGVDKMTAMRAIKGQHWSHVTNSIGDQHE